MIALILALQAAPAVLSQTEQRQQACIALAATDPKAAEAEAERFRIAGGGAKARQCLGMAYTQQGRWREAAMTFEIAAKEAAAAADGNAPRYWAQSGNAWLAGGDTAKAIAALTIAIDSATISAENKGEALLDRARAQVAAGDAAAARSDIDAALDAEPRQPMAWLLSATLARRVKDLPRAQGDITQAIKLAPEDGPIQLEAGNIAALSGNVEAAKAAWQAAARFAPGTPTADNARIALSQFDTAPPAAVPAGSKPVKQPMGR